MPAGLAPVLRHDCSRSSRAATNASADAGSPSNRSRRESRFSRLTRNETGDEALVFPAVRGRALQAATLSKLVRNLGIAAVPHGFRSSFRDWASERTNHPREVMEAALAHAVRNQTEAAYARSDLFERRRHLMEDWGEYLEVVRGQVVVLRRG